MKVTFTNNNLFQKIPQEQRLANTQREFQQETKALSCGLTAGILSGAVTTGVMTYKKLPNKFVNSLSVGSAIAVFTYLGTLLYTTLQNIKNNKG